MTESKTIHKNLLLNTRAIGESRITSKHKKKWIPTNSLIFKKMSEVIENE